MSWDREVLDVLADGYDVHYGARSIKHEVRLIDSSRETSDIKMKISFVTSSRQRPRHAREI